MQDGSRRLVRNTHAGTHVDIEQVTVASMMSPHKNRYLTADREDITAELSGIDRGHIYHVSSDGDLRRISCMHRIADAETQELVKGLRSLRNCDERLLTRYRSGNSFLHKSTALTHTWSLSSQDYTLFAGRVAKLGGLLNVEVHDLDAFREDIVRAQELVAELRREEGEAKAALTAGASKETATAWLRRLLLLRERATEVDAHIHKTRRAYNNTTDLPAEDKADWEIARMPLVSLPVSMVTSLATAQLIAAAKAILEGNKPQPALPLRKEMAMLKDHFPVLRRFLVVSDTEVHLQLDGSRITLSATGYRIEGEEAFSAQEGTSVCDAEHDHGFRLWDAEGDPDGS